MRLTKLLIIACLLGGPLAASAQIRLTITGGTEKAVPIAVVPFRVQDGLSAPDTDIAAVVRSDLHRTGLFDPLPPENFVSRPARSEDVRYQNWRALGADNLVVGSIGSAPNGGVDVRFELMDVYGSKVIVGKRYTAGRDAMRQVAHSISDDIYKALVGRSGAFNTNLLYIQVQGQGDQKRFELKYADADGYKPQTILTSRLPLMSPAWGPQRKRIAYVSFEEHRSEIYVQNVSTGKRHKVASFKGINGAPAFSPDGRRLAMTLSRDGNPDIYILDLDTGKTQRVTTHYGIDTEPVWTPDGRSIVFTSDRAGGPQIYRVPVNGGTPKRLTFDGSYNASPSLSSKGRLLAMVHRDDSGFHIAVMDLKSGLTRVLTHGNLDESPSFSPNGAMVVYTRAVSNGTQLATVSVHGRADQTLREVKGDVREPAWSPL